VAAAFDRERLLLAFDRIGAAAAAQSVMLDMALYGGSALMIAGNFRFATEDADIAELERPWPGWLTQIVAEIASEQGWAADWLNEGVQFHLSPLADQVADHIEFATFPRGGTPGLRVSVPSAQYMRALKLKAMRIDDPLRGAQEADDIRNLLRTVGVATIDDAIAVLGRYFPRSAKDADRQRFLLKHIWPGEVPDRDPPRYPMPSR
jgi:hypothetical protein